MGTPVSFGPNYDQNIIVQVQYDKAGRVLNQRDPRGNLSAYAYDLLNRRTSASDPLGNTWSTQFVNQNRVLQTSSTDPLGNTTRRSADQVGRLKLIQYLAESPKNTPDVTYSYDKAGNPLGMKENNASAPGRKTLYSYDKARRPSQVDVDTDGNSIIHNTFS